MRDREKVTLYTTVSDGRRRYSTRQMDGAAPVTAWLPTSYFMTKDGEIRYEGSDKVYSLLPSRRNIHAPPFIEHTTKNGRVVDSYLTILTGRHMRVELFCPNRHEDNPGLWRWKGKGRRGPKADEESELFYLPQGYKLVMDEQMGRWYIEPPGELRPDGLAPDRPQYISATMQSRTWGLPYIRRRTKGASCLRADVTDAYLDGPNDSQTVIRTASGLWRIDTVIRSPETGAAYIRRSYSETDPNPAPLIRIPRLRLQG